MPSPPRSRRFSPLEPAQQLAEHHVTLFTDECHFTELEHLLAAKLFAQHLAPLL